MTTTPRKRPGPKPGPTEERAERMALVLSLYCAGLCFKKISARLGVSTAQISYDICCLMRKHGVHTHAQLAIYADRNGLLESKPPSESERRLISQAPDAASPRAAGGIGQ
jgi:DNA-binding NarL/FixJ family response regulator